MLKRMRFRGPSVVADIREKYGFDGDLLEIFASVEGASVMKWHHYIPIYDRYFSRFRATGVRFLEIGVAGGGSLQMWRRYFGPDATIFGIDINPNCAAFDGKAGHVRIGSQTDADFLRDVVSEMGGVDVVLDDGSHVMNHVRRTLRLLFPLLSDNGVYMIEDMHTAYMPPYGGGIEAQANIYNDVRKIIDDMHRWYHSDGIYAPSLRDSVRGLHVHDSIVVLEKGRAYPPVYSTIPTQAGPA
jgi:cephalosporin hydroxylase